VKVVRLLFIFLVVVNVAFGQQSDTAFERIRDIIPVDTSYANIDSDETSLTIARPDSLIVKKRSFNEEQIQRLKSDPDFNYKLPPTVAESLWDRLLAWLGNLIANMFDKAVNTNWGQALVYIVGLALLVVVIMMLLKVNAFKIFYSGAGATQKYQVLDENIHEMDFEKLVQEAIDKQDYRRGTRLLFLYALKLLADKDLIHWELGKTNRDYVVELSKQELKSGLNDLSYYFDYAWYGNFNISRETFNKVQGTFADWKNKLD
jgi:hypothetical protein